MSTKVPAKEVHGWLVGRYALTADEKKHLASIEVRLDAGTSKEDQQAALKALPELLNEIDCICEWALPNGGDDLEPRAEEVLRRLEGYFAREKAFAGLSPEEVRLMARRGLLEMADRCGEVDADTAVGRLAALLKDVVGQYRKDVEKLSKVDAAAKRVADALGGMDGLGAALKEVAGSMEPVTVRQITDAAFADMGERNAAAFGDGPLVEKFYEEAAKRLNRAKIGEGIAKLKAKLPEGSGVTEADLWEIFEFAGKGYIR